MRVTALLVAASLLTAGCVQIGKPAAEPPPPDAECRSPDACAAAYEAARTRAADCRHKGGDCSAWDAAQHRALLKKHEAAKASEQAERDAHHAERARQDAASAQVHSNIGRADSCSGILALEAAAARSSSTDEAERYRKAAAQNRKQQASRIASDLSYETTKPRRAVVDMPNPREVLSPIEATRARLTELRCLDPATADLSEAKVQRWAAAIEKDVSEEEACRASVECMTARAAAPICDAIERRRQWMQDMAKERRNPSGYVNPKYLHELGQSIQDEDAKVAELKPQFAAAAKKPFAESMCVKRK